MNRINKNLLTIGLILFWSLEIWVAQYLTVGYDYPSFNFSEIVSFSWRFILNLVFVLTLFFLLNHWLLVFAFLIWFLFSNSIILYHSIFDRTLSWNTILFQASEGVQGLGNDVSLFDGKVFLVLLFLLVVKIYILYRIRKYQKSNVPFNSRDAFRLSIVFGIVYVVTIYVGTVRVDSLSKLTRYASVDRMATTHGYLVTWFGEHKYLNSNLRERAIKRGEITDESVTSMLTGIDLTGIEDVIMIQVESLDWRSMGYRFNGDLITPFINSLMDKSVLFKTESIHINGSADSDFVWLMGKNPSEDVVTYKIDNYPYTDTIANKFESQGFESTFAHGNVGKFFNRGQAVDQMGFSKVYFEPTLIKLGAPKSGWGIADDVVYSLLEPAISKSSQSFTYIITMSSHWPFDHVPILESRLPIDESSDLERYYAAINYADSAINDFYNKVPDDTLILIFGDHGAPVAFNAEETANSDRYETIPVIVHRKNKNLKSLMGVEKVIEAPLHGIVTWVHSSIDFNK